MRIKYNLKPKKKIILDNEFVDLATYHIDNDYISVDIGDIWLFCDKTEDEFIKIFVEMVEHECLHKAILDTGIVQDEIAEEIMVYLMQGVDIRHDRKAKNFYNKR